MARGVRAPRERWGRGALRAGPDARQPAVAVSTRESYHLDVEQIHNLGERIVAVVREVGRGRASGMLIDGRWGYVVTVEGGQIVRIEAYRDANRALQAAGLPTGPPGH